MDLYRQLMQKHDKENMQLIRDYIGADEGRFSLLMKLFFSDEYRIQQRSSWAVIHCIDRHPGLIRPYLARMLPLLDQPVHDAVKRNITRIFRHIDIPRSLYGEVADKCFKFMLAPEATPAIKVFSMYSLLKIVQDEPELEPEFRLVIEENLPYASTAFRTASAKVFKQLDRLKRNRPGPQRLHTAAR